MKNKVASLALILTFAGSLGFACEKNKNHEGAPEAQSISATQDAGKNANKNAKAKVKSKDKTQQTPSEDRQYQQALFAIYG
jgi:hypothetical protein